MEIETLKKLRKQLERGLQGKSKTMLYRFSYDISSFNYLVEALKHEELTIPVPRVITKEKDVHDKVFEDIYKFKIIGEIIVDMYKDLDYMLYRNKGYIKLSKKDKEDLIREFLIYFNNNSLSLYDELKNSGYIFKGDLGDLIGESYLLNQSKLYYCGIDKDNKNDLYEIETIIHELMHIYTEKFLSNYGWSSSNNTINGFYSETIPLLSELMLYQFFMDKHIYTKEINFHMNFTDYDMLTHYKAMVYLGEMYDREDAYINCDYFNYHVVGNNTFDKDHDVPIYRYPEHYKDGTFWSYVYSISNIDAYTLYEKILNGDKNVINEYLVSLQNKDKFIDDFYDPRDITFMRDQIVKHLELCKNNYKK